MIKTSQSEINYQLLHLASWPALPHLLHDTAPHMTRICALLARRPSIGILIPVMLDIPPHIAHSLLETLHANGHIYPAATVPPHHLLLDAGPVQGNEPAESISFLTMIWQHLINKK